MLSQNQQQTAKFRKCWKSIQNRAFKSTNDRGVTETKSLRLHVALVVIDINAADTELKAQGTMVNKMVDV